MLAEFLAVTGHEPLPESVGVFLRWPESFIQVFGAPLGLALLVVAADAVDKNPSLAFAASEPLGDFVQTTIEPLDKRVLDHTLFYIKGMDHSQHGPPSPLNLVAS